jgi:hypothetical protein
MLGFHPLASAALADDKLVAITNHALNPSEITTPAPIVDDSTITQNHDLNTEGFDFGSWNLPYSTLTEATGIFGLSDITTGTPIVDDATITQAHSLTANELTSGTPTVDDSTITENDVLTSTDITLGTPTIDDATISIVYNLVPQDVTCGTPIVDDADMTVPAVSPVAEIDIHTHNDIVITVESITDVILEDRFTLAEVA